MCDLYTFMGNHPFLTTFLALVVSGTVVGTVRAARGVR